MLDKDMIVNQPAENQLSSSIFIVPVSSTTITIFYYSNIWTDIWLIQEFSNSRV